MIFNTWTFAIFLAVFYIIYWFIIKPEWRHVGLLAAGLIFYTYYFPAYTLVIGLFALFVYYCGLYIQKKIEAKEKLRAKKIFLLSVILCVALLVQFKYLKLLAATLNDIISLGGSSLQLNVPTFIVPLGLSFFVFEFIHYLVDVWHGRIKKSSLLPFGAFIMFFPTLVAGPIKRYQSFSSQVSNVGEHRIENLSQGLYRIIIGIAKKVLIADLIGIYAEPLLNFSKNPDVSSPALWVSLYAYAIKIYYDFSGYSDIAIGSARLLGFEVPENFNKPYLKQNIAEFWRNWHMSLSSWLRDYVYMSVGKKVMPVVGKTAPFAAAAVCQITTMAVCGIWHGSTWNFLIWGLYHGAGMTVHKAFADYVASSRRKPVKGANKIDYKDNFVVQYAKRFIFTLVTFNFVSIGWVFFVLDIKSAYGAILKLLFIR